MITILIVAISIILEIDAYTSRKIDYIIRVLLKNGQISQFHNFVKILSNLLRQKLI